MSSYLEQLRELERAEGELKRMKSELQKISPPTEAIQLVTPLQAAHWLSTCKFERQREIKRGHVNDLVEEIKAGRFRAKTQVSFCKLSDRFYLVNGQHTLTSLVQADVPLLLAVTVTEVRDMEEVANEYSRHDSGWTRRGADALYAHRIDEELGVSNTVLQKVTSASVHYAFVLNELPAKEVTRLTHDKKVLIVRRHGPLNLEAAMKTGLAWNTRRLQWAYRKSLLACLTFTYRHQAASAIEFWGAMFEDDGLAAKDPRKVLLKDYEQSGFNNGGVGRLSAANLVTDQDIPRMAAVAWNAYVERRTLSFIRFDRAKRTAEFKGCGEVPV